MHYFWILRLLLYIRWSVAADTVQQYVINTDPQIQLELKTPDLKLPEGDLLDFTVREQTDDLCDAGTRQWTGSIPVSKAKSIFYWFFESRGDPQNDPIIVWLNGGPGGSSLLGLFTELGPCLVNRHGNSTAYNPYSWANNASMLFIDQPSGVGFSKIKNASYMPIGLAMAAEDFNLFLSRFFTEVFGNLTHLPLHFAGESFGGHYIPYYTPVLLERQRTKAEHHLPLTISSIILVNALIDWSPHFAGQYDYFCADEDGENGVGTGFNETACRAMAADIPECESLGRVCRETYDAKLCKHATGACWDGVGRWVNSDMGPGRPDPYDDRQNCTVLPFCGHLGFKRITTYLNTPWVQTKLGFANHSFSPNTDEITLKWQASGAVDVPTTREMTWILDNTDIEVLVMNGNNDVVVNTPGQIRQYDSLPWHLQALYRLRKFEDWFYVNAAGFKVKAGQIKGAGKLWFASIDQAGHESPKHQPLVTMELVNRWIWGKNLRDA